MQIFQMRLRKTFFIVLLIFIAQLPLSAQLFVTAFPTFNANTNSHVPFSREGYLRYLDDPRMLQLGLDLDWRGFGAYIRFEIFQNPALWYSGMAYSNIIVPMPGVPFTGSINANFPSEGWLAYGNDYFDITVGRRKFSMGPGKYGLTLGRQAPALDAYWLGIHPMPNYKVRLYGILAGAMSNLEANRRWLTRNQRYWDTKAASNQGAWVDKYNPDTAGYPQMNRYQNAFKGFFVHKIGAEGDWWRVGISESIMVYGGFPSLDIVSPVTVWHNSYFINANAILGISAEVKLPQDWRLYAEWGMDDLALGEFDKDKPTAMSFLLGTDWQVLKTDEPYKGQIYEDRARLKSEDTFRAKDGLVIGLETVYTSRYMYGRPNDDPFGKLSFFTSPQYGTNSWPLVEYYLGFPYGPQSYLLELNTTYSQGNWYVEADIAYLLEGKKGLGVFNMDDPASSHDPDVIPSAANRHGGPFIFEGPLAHSLILQVTLYYYLRQWVQLYAGTFHKIRMDRFNQTVSSVSLGVAFHLSNNWLLSDENRKQPNPAV